MLIDFTDGSVRLRPELFAQRLVIQAYAYNGVGTLSKDAFGDGAALYNALPEYMVSESESLTLCRWIVDLDLLAVDGGGGELGDGDRYHFWFRLDASTWRGDGTSTVDGAEVHFFQAALAFSSADPFNPEEHFDLEIRSWYAAGQRREEIMPMHLTLSDLTLSTQLDRDVSGDGFPPPINPYDGCHMMYRPPVREPRPEPTPRFERDVLDE